MTCINTLCQTYAELPWSTIIQYSLASGVSSFLVTTAYSGGNFAAGGISGAVSAIATIFNALIQPLISFLFACPNKHCGRVSLAAELAKRVSILYAANLMLQYFKKPRIDLLTSSVITFASMIFEYVFYKHEMPNENSPAYFFTTTIPMVRV